MAFFLEVFLRCDAKRGSFVDDLGGANVHAKDPVHNGAVKDRARNALVNWVESMIFCFISQSLVV